MNKKRKIHPLRLILIILIIIMLFVIAFFSIKLFFSNDSKTKENETIQNSPSDNENIKIEINNYTVYLDNANELGFNFIVANLKFSTNKNTLYYDLSNLTNSEREIKLSDVDDYLNKLKNYNYELNNIEIAKEVKSTNNSCDVNIFIPFVNKSGELNIYNGEKLTFDLNKNVKDATTLKPTNHQDQTVINTNDYNVVINGKPFLSTMMTHNGTDYNASGINVYTFKIKVNNVSGNVYIEDAVFIKENATVEYKALDETYQSLKVDNIINIPLKAGSTGALFFELYKNKDAEINYNGVLRIKFSDTNEWVEIPTTIK